MTGFCFFINAPKHLVGPDFKQFVLKGKHLNVQTFKAYYINH